MTPRPSGPVLLSLVLPCFNEQGVIARTHQTILASLGSLPDVELEIVYVDDGSGDDTPKILAGLAASDSRVRVVCLSRNFGHQAAVTAGLDHARGHAVAVLDADLQDPPGVVLEMLQAWRQGFDVVYAVRTKRKETAWKRAAYSAFYRMLSRLAHVDIPCDSGDFSLMDRAVVQRLKELPERNRFVRGLRAWVGFRQTGVVYERQARQGGESHYSFWKLVRLALDGLFNFSTLPLTAVFVMGLFISAVSSLAVLGLILFKLTGASIMGHTAQDLPGYTSVTLAIFFFGGVQLASLGLIGEYVGRIYMEVKGRPPYLVREVMNGEARPAGEKAR
ncbi:putative glycosyltransferase [Fundidesulfovibrio magnetotacticus]|uniref:Putative glycosyltransferase n=1 Tax=Fundidesulfovibrio magnetotacticus TaxID=2730080 RepID=A0A6V8LSW9_9BACT|nr:glycosyltransferase family 2 protein [Fundidesulfovibrio magnetotacticus]GFK92717.1 putative glycosyltransferase [Fundidesulfovibrio magnetotacticus]